MLLGPNELKTIKIDNLLATKSLACVNTEDNHFT